MQFNPALLPALLAGSLATSSVPCAVETADAIQALKKPIEEPGQKVRILERHREIDGETAQAKPPGSRLGVWARTGISTAT